LKIDDRFVPDKTRSDFVEIFNPCLQEIERLMRSQLVSAKRAEYDVKVSAIPTLLTREAKKWVESSPHWWVRNCEIPSVVLERGFERDKSRIRI
jgi:hypothetical protein